MPSSTGGSTRRFGFEGVIGSSPQMQKVIEILKVGRPDR